MIKIVLFDFGNVLVTYENVFNKVCRDFSIEIDDLLKFCNEFHESMSIGEIETDAFWNKCIERFNLNKNIAKNYDFPGAWVSDYGIIKPVRNFIYKMEGKIEMGIISNIYSGIWEAALRDGWVPKINYKSIILSYKVGSCKPGNEIYKVAQKKVGVRAEEILFIDDKEENLVEPKKMGWKTLLFDPKEAEKGVEEIKKILEY